MAEPPAGVTVTWTVESGWPLPSRIGCLLLVRLSVADTPGSFCASCCRPMAAVGAGSGATSTVTVDVALPPAVLVSV